MKFYRRHLQPLGFKGSGMYCDSKFHAHWYKVFENLRVVVGLSCTIPQGVYKFSLTPSELKAFHAGKLSLTPPGSCHPSNTPNKEDFEWVHEGEVKDLKRLKWLLDSVEKAGNSLATDALIAAKADYDSLLRRHTDLTSELSNLQGDLHEVRAALHRAKRHWDKQAAKLVG